MSIGSMRVTPETKLQSTMWVFQDKPNRIKLSHVVETTRFLEGQKIELTDHPLDSVDLVPIDFYSFPSVKNKLRGQRFLSCEEAFGVSLLIRKAAASVSPVCSLTKNDDGSYTFLMSTPLKNTSTTFKPGEEFEGERINGEKVTILITLDSSKLIEVQFDSKGVMSKIVREFSADQMVASTIAEGWDEVCIRTYEVIN
ncbi:Fatty acid-binding protein, muscle [Eumeta japonica]|uniref:Fatty acid-binding protein, muscle n=1 Tax=Eumeta variegata TaxID=151549 RepID=A0A4C1VCP5_EUMVA|nr:Fatty acid-binding protein, muscle [Eumeta japonica]